MEIIKTREGNPIYPKASPFRQIAREADKFSMCLPCTHLGDLCAGQNREFKQLTGHRVVSDCNGHEHYNGPPNAGR